MDEQIGQQGTDLQLGDPHGGALRRPHGQRTEHPETHESTVTAPTDGIGHESCADPQRTVRGRPQAGP
ncbi:hypothetical protein GCM10009608_39820 [Pseudonocardia alaniniphila]